MKYLGLDYGGKRIGVALSDAGGAIAFPRETIPNDDQSLERLAALAKDERVERIVIGDTRSHNGAENPVTAEAEAFMEALTRATGISLSRTPELFSSVEASRYAPEGKEHDDSAAAAFILQRFLDMRGDGRSPTSA